MTDTIHARDIMVAAESVGADLPLRDLARLLVDRTLDGVCVVGDGGKLEGVVTAMDLLFQEKPVKGPAIFWLIDSPIILGQSRFQHDLERHAATAVRDVMTKHPTVVSEDAGLDQIATLMVDNTFTILPVVRDGLPVGMITKWAVLRRVLQHDPPKP